ncbi:tyrosine-type recombinase/integrase [Kribbella catacumbae]|uniref:tyrosine-type recombinase/integrase n=1 Tax=Kribbella catacumbae TaxID=460086 RepID=UPI0007C447DB|nr:tyrosine-type recombinase/integrase [Kribbella catacumbae]
MVRARSRVSGVVVSGPLEPFVGAYRLELESRGYTPRSMVPLLRQVGRLSRWLRGQGLTPAQLDEHAVEAFFAVQRAGGRYRSQWSRPGLRCLLDVLGELGVARPAVSCPGSDIEVLVGCFERYLLDERGLAIGTVGGYVAHARRFVGGLSGQELHELEASQVTAAVLREVDRGVSVSAAQNFVAGLRAFLRYCFLDGRIGTDLAGAALAVTGRRRSTLPQGISPGQARALLDSCDRRTALGRRDYAIILSLLRLGLRRGELAAVTLDDLDWRAGEMVIHGKGGRTDRLPLPADVGAAIAGYLSRGRSASSRRELFLRARAPFGPIESGTVSSTVRRACRRAGIASMGAHRLRHTMACQMVDAGVPLIQIGQVLRHQSLQSTGIYARVDVERLRELAPPWPGVVQR